MSLVIRDTGTVPDDKWWYPVEATGTRIDAPNWAALYTKVEAHCAANNIQPPGLQAVIDWCCRNLKIPCYDDTTKMPLANSWSLGLPVVLPGCCSKKPSP